VKADFFFENNLTAVLSDFKIILSNEQIKKLQKHFEIMQSWGKVHNLTTVLDQNKVIYDHYVDCILGLSFLKPVLEIYDLGSGAGFPGLVAAVVWPQTEIFLIEASRKKCSFLQEASRLMKLDNVIIKQERVETLRDIQFAISRAAFSLPTMKTASTAMAKEGKLVLWMGKFDKKIQGDLLKAGLIKEKVFAYSWEGLKERHIVLLRKN